MPPPSSFLSLRAAIDWATAHLAQSGLASDDARIDARVLARHAFGLDAAGLIVHEPDPPDARQAQAFAHAVLRRGTREPVAYITGLREFYGRDFEVSPAVLIPRPETELIVDLALERCPDRAAAWQVVDVGTGSGCIAVTLALELTGARVVATDISTDALGVARANAARHGVADRVDFKLVSLVASPGPVDLIVSNPPYVSVEQRHVLAPDVRDYEPAHALYAGIDGLAVIRALVQHAAGVLVPGTGWLIVECGVGQEAAVRALLANSGGYADVTVTKDLQGIPRTFAARRT